MGEPSPEHSNKRDSRRKVAADSNTSTKLGLVRSTA